MELIDPSEKYIGGYRKAYLESLNMIAQNKMKRHDLMFRDPEKTDVIKKLFDHRDKSKLKPGKVLAYDYFLVDKDLFLGTVTIRTELTNDLLNFGGNIGYGINPIFWGKGYGNEILRLGLEKAKELGIKDQVLITCDFDNVASARIIEYNGGVLDNIIKNNIDGEEILTRRYWIAL